MPKQNHITDDFMLESDPARRLYHDFAAGAPIIDYHCHLPPDHIAADHRFENMTELWLAGDHYKWRAMRAAGVDERFCSGHAPAYQKFIQWARTVPQLIRNPLYDWSHMELRRTFGITDRLLAPDTSDTVWTDCNAKLATPEFSCRSLLRRANVEVICTTDDPVDSLAHHQAIAADATFDIAVWPTWRPDRALAVEDASAFNAWADALAEAAQTEIGSFDAFLGALHVRHAHFHKMGCRLSDHGLETVWAEDVPASEASRLFDRLRGGAPLEGADAVRFKSAMLYEFAVMDHARDWAQQFHLGALRNCNSRLFAALGPDCGCDSIGDAPLARPLARFLDRLDREERLTRTVLYNLNPRDNALMASMIGNFQDGRTPGKIQWGAAWWFLDQRHGMTEQLDTLSRLGLLSRFVGMLTDSRSFLSFARHDYFRRLLCNILGDEMHRGLIPNDEALVGGMVRDICHNNAANYFAFATNS